MNTEQISEHAKAAAEKIRTMGKPCGREGGSYWDQGSKAESMAEGIIQSAITAATAELQSHKDRVQKVMPKIAGLFGIEHPIQLIAAAENDQEDYFDILVKLGGKHIADLEQRLADDVETFAILAGERDFLKGHVADLERQLAEAKRELSAVQGQHEVAMEHAVSGINECEEMRRDRDQLRADVVTLAQKYAEKSNELDKLKEELEKLRTQYNHRHGDYAIELSRNEQLRAGIEVALAEKNTAVKKWVGRLKMAEKERDELRDEVEKLRADLERQLAELKHAQYAVFSETPNWWNGCDPGPIDLIDGKWHIKWRDAAIILQEQRNEAYDDRDQLRAANAEQAKEIERLREAIRCAWGMLPAEEFRDSLEGPDRVAVEQVEKVLLAALAKEDKQPEPPRYSAEELRKWWPAKCPECGWRGLSRDASGGGPIADTGDYDDVTCPKCSAFVEGDDEAEQKGAQP